MKSRHTARRHNPMMRPACASLLMLCQSEKGDCDGFVGADGDIAVEVGVVHILFAGDVLA